MANSLSRPLSHYGSLTILKAGVLSLLQDQGRIGHQHMGVSPSGVMDLWTAGWANRLVGNTPHVPQLEITHGGLAFAVSAPTVIALTGTPVKFTINGKRANLWQSYPLVSGDVVQIGQASPSSQPSSQPPSQPFTLLPGLRHYLAIRGGFVLTPILDSVSVNLREGIGGLSGFGSPLKRGDQLIFQASLAQTRLMLPAHKWSWWESDTELFSEQHLRVIPCAQYQAFPKILRRQLFSHHFTVSQQSNRMGYRLEGSHFRHDLPGMLSEPTGLGVIQIPNGGVPIVLLNDRQTLGGYPKLGAVAEIDCWRLGQMRPGQVIRFQLTSVVRAQVAKSALLTRMKQLKLQTPAS